jgi:hypothetical protein
MARAVNAASGDPANRAKSKGIGAVMSQKRGSDGLQSMVASEADKWTPEIRAANIRSP